MTDDLEWRDDLVPRSRRYGDTYFSAQDGLGETGHVFLGGNGLPHRWIGRNDFVIGELGFGTGLNFLATLERWRGTMPPAVRLTYIAFELYPLDPDDIARAISPWPVLAGAAARLCAQWPLRTGWNRLDLDQASLHLAVGDANKMVETAPAAADAWYLDGFNPRTNPQLWNRELLAAVHDRTVPGGTFATYTAAGWVRRNLVGAGFVVRKLPGFGRKRDMLAGVKAGPGRPPDI